jgi:hypothetical protein
LGKLTPQIDVAVAQLAGSVTPVIDRFTSRAIDLLNQFESGEDEPLFAMEEGRHAGDRASDSECDALLSKRAIRM